MKDVQMKSIRYYWNAENEWETESIRCNVREGNKFVAGNW